MIEQSILTQMIRSARNQYIQNYNLMKEAINKTVKTLVYCFIINEARKNKTDYLKKKASNKHNVSMKLYGSNKSTLNTAYKQ